MRRPIIAGNWKMNTSLEEAVALATGVRALADSIDSVDRVLIPPFPWIVPVAAELEGSSISVGAQNCYHEASGAFTGEVSAEMIAPHCTHVVLGHSERRHILGETDEQIASRIAAVHRTDMMAILCVGETLEQRNAGSANDVVAGQLRGSLKHATSDDMTRVVIAYEPVWAIGTGVAASADDAQEMAAFVRSIIQEQYGGETAAAIRIQYGGSVKADNALALMACPDVDGALVGGASLDASEFSGIIHAAANDSN